MCLCLEERLFAYNGQAVKEKHIDFLSNRRTDKTYRHRH